MEKEMNGKKIGYLFTYNGFFNTNAPLKCKVPNNKDIWIFQVNSISGISEEKIIIGINEKEDYLEIKRLELVNEEEMGCFIDQYLRKYCKEYKGIVIVLNMERWKNE